MKRLSIDMIRRVLPWLMLMSLCGFSSYADAAVLCSNASGLVFVRSACQSNETTLDPASVGLVGPAGPQGPQGPAGPQGEPGPAADARKLVFVTSGLYSLPLYPGWFNAYWELNGADAKCNQEAADASLPGTYVAWLSVYFGPVSARDRLTRSASYYRTDGVLVANSWADLLKGRISAPINVTAGGTALPSGAVSTVWTGTYTDGELISGAGPNETTCGDWDNQVGPTAITGDATAYGGQWSWNANTECTTSARLYCFQQ